METEKRSLPISREDLDLEQYTVKNDTIDFINSYLKELEFFEETMWIKLKDLATTDYVVRDLIDISPLTIVERLKELYRDWNITLTEDDKINFNLK